MITFSPSQETFLRQYQDDDADVEFLQFPIVGWLNLTGRYCEPYFPVGGVIIGSNSVYCFCAGDEVVTYVHPSSGKTWLGAETNEMESFVQSYMKAHPMPKSAEKGDASVNASSDPKPGPDTRPLHFGSQKYKSKSFWSWPDANAVFEIEADQVYPSDPRAVKIKRDEFAQLKRDGAYKIDPHAGVIEEDEPEQKGDPSTPEINEDFGDFV